MALRGTLVVGALLAVVGAGCASGPTGQTTYLGRSDLVSVTVSNSLPTTACYIWMTAIDAPEWGLDWLGPGQVMLPGTTRSFQVPRGHWDLRIGTCTGTDLVQMQSVAIDDQHNALNLASPPPPATRPYVPTSGGTSRADTPVTPAAM